jgi:1,4-dihydroxy-6-naphthoate synthase
VHAQEMSQQVMRQHIDLYVNNFSLSLETAGRAAIASLLKVFNYDNNKVFVD